MPLPAALTRAPAFRRKLLDWFRQHGRDLPWRRTRDPYHIAVSEFMLQQTQVSRVLEFYQRFLQRYPSIESLASAPPTAVRESWDGLGYYRRAANLHRLAQQVVELRGGSIPSDPAELRLLPGVGRYTAGAIASFAFERSTAAVDTNVARVLRRAFHPRVNGPAITRKLWSTAERVLPRQGKTAWTFNQAMIELGALVCTAREARCAICPVRSECATGKSKLARELSRASRPRTAQPGRKLPRSRRQCADGLATRQSSALPRRSGPVGPGERQ